MTRIMPLGLMIHTLKKVFNRLNPDGDEDEIDWNKTIDYPISFTSALHDMATEYPQYVWFEESLEEIEQKEKDIEIQNLIDSLLAKGLDEETIDRIVEEREMKTIKGGWKVGWVAGEKTYSKTVKIKPHLKGKHMRGRIQATCDPEFIGLEAKITFVKPEEPNKESMDWEPNEYD